MEDICNGIKKMSIKKSKINKKKSIRSSNVNKNETYSKEIVKKLLMYMNDELDICICNGHISMQGDIRKLLDMQCTDADEDGEIIDYCRFVMCVSCLSDKHSNYLKSKYK
jgi:hypothetical protein